MTESKKKEAGIIKSLAYKSLMLMCVSIVIAFATGVGFVRQEFMDARMEIMQVPEMQIKDGKLSSSVKYKDIRDREGDLLGIIDFREAQDVEGFSDLKIAYWVTQDFVVTIGEKHDIIYDISEYPDQLIDQQAVIDIASIYLSDMATIPINMNSLYHLSRDALFFKIKEAPFEFILVLITSFISGVMIVFIFDLVFAILAKIFAFKLSFWKIIKKSFIKTDFLFMNLLGLVTLVSMYLFIDRDSTLPYSFGNLSDMGMMIYGSALLAFLVATIVFIPITIKRIISAAKSSA